VVTGKVLVAVTNMISVSAAGSVLEKAVLADTAIAIEDEIDRVGRRLKGAP